MDTDGVADFVASMGVTFPVLVDPGTDVYTDWYFASDNASAPYPREYVVDRDGNVAWLSDEIDVAEIADAIEGALAE